MLAGAASPSDPVQLDPESVVRGWLSVVGVHNYEPRHLTQAVEFLADSSERWPWADLVSRPVGLAELGGLLSCPPGGRPRSAVRP